MLLIFFIRQKFYRKTTRNVSLKINYCNFCKKFRELLEIIGQVWLRTEKNELVKTVSIVKNDTEAEDLLLENKESVSEFDVQDEDFSRDFSWKSRRREKTRNHLKCALAVVAVVLLLCVSFGVGLVLGWKLLENDSPNGGGGGGESNDYWGSTVATKSINQWIPGKLNAENIRKYLK